MIAYAVSQRTRELGLRMALGARRGDLLALVLTRGMALALAGLAVGLAAAFSGTRLLAGFLYGTSRTDPLTFGLVSGLLLGTPIGDLDSLIAAHALSQDLTLVSNNLRELDRVPGLKTENWVSASGTATA